MLLAESVDMVSDTEWTVHLRQGVTFSNGNPFTADDVIFSIQKHKDSGATGSPRVQTIDAEKTYAIDDYTLSMQLLAPNVANWSITAMLVIYDAESYDPETGSQNPIGTGPYSQEYVPNSYLSLERRDDYWGELPDAKYLNFRILAETSQRVNALETGLVDIAPLATEDVEYVKTLSGFNVDSRYTGNFKFIVSFGRKFRLLSEH
jgi:peptide/nickel transport system substrate-binding protein